MDQEKIRSFALGAGVVLGAIFVATGIGFTLDLVPVTPETMAFGANVGGFGISFLLARFAIGLFSRRRMPA